MKRKKIRIDWDFVWIEYSKEWNQELPLMWRQTIMALVDNDIEKQEDDNGKNFR
jgi:hypothetical protein